MSVTRSWVSLCSICKRPSAGRGPAASASYTLIGAILLLGGIGFVVDRWLETPPWFLLAGLLMGIVVGFYELAKTVWKP